MTSITGWACVDGETMPLASATLPLAERSVLQGDAVFEVLRTYGGRPHALRAHLERLRGSCERVGLSPAPVDALRSDVQGVLAQTAGEAGEWALRLWLGARGAPGLVRVSEETRRAVLATPLPPYDPSLYREGVGAVTQVDAAPGEPTHGAKTTNYLASIVATTSARRQGAHEVIRLGLHGEVLEGASSSLFAVTEGGVFTPPLQVGILPGITRQRVLRLAESAGFGARERLLTCHDLYRAREVFLTSSIRELMPVVRMDGTPIGSGRPGPVTARLLADYRGDAAQ